MPTSRSILILSDDPDDADLGDLSNLVRDYGVDLTLLTPNDLTIRLDGSGGHFWHMDVQLRPDLVVGWVRENLFQHSAAQLETFERLSVPVLDSARVLMQGHSPYLKSLLLHTAKVSHLPLVAGRAPQAVIELAKEVGYPIAVRPLGFPSPDGDPLGGAVNFDNEGSLRRFLTERAAAERFYMQFQVRRIGRSARVFCVNHHPVACLLTAPDDWPTALESTPWDIAAIAAQASRAVGGWACLVEVVEDLDGGCLQIRNVSVGPRLEADLSWAEARPVVLKAQAHFLSALVASGPRTLHHWRPPSPDSMRKPE